MFLNIQRETRERLTSDSSWHFWTTMLSWAVFNFVYSSSSFLFFHLALRFWNQTATWRGSSPKSEASLSFLSVSNLCSSPKFISRKLTCSALSFLFLAPLTPSPVFFFRLRRGLDSPKHVQEHMLRKHHQLIYKLMIKTQEIMMAAWFSCISTNLVLEPFECINRGTIEIWVLCDLQPCDSWWLSSYWLSSSLFLLPHSR